MFLNQASFSQIMPSSHGFLGGPSLIPAAKLDLNASNSSSYSGTGTTWTSIGNIQFNTTLVNGVTFVENGDFDYMSFDGSNDYIQFPTLTLARSGSAWFAWVYVTDFSSFTSGKTVNSRILVRGESGYNRLFALYNCCFGFECNLNSNPVDIASDTTPNHSVAGIGTGKWMNICMNFKTPCLCR